MDIARTHEVACPVLAQDCGQVQQVGPGPQVVFQVSQPTNPQALLEFPGFLQPGPDGTELVH